MKRTEESESPEETEDYRAHWITKKFIYAMIFSATDGECTQYNSLPHFSQKVSKGITFLIAK